MLTAMTGHFPDMSDMAAPLRIYSRRSVTQIFDAKKMVRRAAKRN
jgi:hypothetical protein